MNARLFLVPIYFVSVFLFPFFVFVPLAVVLIAYFEAYVSVLVGALIVDTIYGTSSIFGGPFFYTILLFLLSSLAYALRTRLLE